MGFTTIWLLVCTAIAAGGIYFIVRGRRGGSADARAVREWAHTSGRVLELRTQHQRPTNIGTGPPGHWYMPVVEFALPDGRVVRAESLTGGRPAPAKVGEMVPLFYDPADPRRIMVNKGLARPGTANTMLTVVGAVALAISLMGVGLWILLVPVLGVPV